MKAIILAAGYATRLYPITIEKPKTLLEIGKRRMLDLIIEKIPEEISDIHVIVNSKFYSFFEKWQKENPDVDINLINDGTTSEQNKLGAIRDMRMALLAGREDDALVLASDNLFDFKLNGAFDLFKKKNKDVIIAYDIQDKSKAARFGVLSVDATGKVIKFEEKPKRPETSLVSTALYFFTKESLKLLPDYINESKDNDGPGYFVKWLASKKDVYVSIAEGRWYDIGTLETYEEAKRIFS